jgi:hypothetical protein
MFNKWRDVTNNGLIPLAKETSGGDEKRPALKKDRIDMNRHCIYIPE